MDTTAEVTKDKPSNHRSKSNKSHHKSDGHKSNKKKSSSSKTKKHSSPSSHRPSTTQDPLLPQNQSTIPWASPKDFKINTKIKEGSQGIVYSGTFRSQPIAIKKIHNQSPADASKFISEVETLAHPNICLLICACSVPGNYLVGFQLVQNGTLKQLLEGPEHPSLVEKFKIAHTATLGLDWIHRNLVHGSLSTSKILVMPDFTAKICGFGISGGIPHSALSDFADHIHYWNWKNPEEPESKAHDVYSLALVFWSLFLPASVTDRLPFKEITSYDAYVVALKKGARPPLDHIPPLVAELCQSMWAKNPTARPELLDLKLFDMMVDATLPCPTSRAVWRQTAQVMVGTEYPTYVHMHTFIEKLYQGTGETKPLPDAPQYRCLERMFGTQIEATGEATKFVKLERFSQMISWFGPLKGSRTARFKWIWSLENLMRQSWFHAESTKLECDKAIADNKKLGSFLVRFSSSAPEAPFTLAKLDQKSVINNLRIYATDQGYYCQALPNVIETTLPVLIEKLTKPLHLKVAVEYQPFLVLFETTSLAGCYGSTSPSVGDDNSDP